MSDHLVSVGLPVRNAADRIERVVKSVLGQDHQNLELIISDNASTDDTADVCGSLARSDDRIKYHRQAHNIGLLNNFNAVFRLATGEFFRWMGDDDWLAPNNVSKCVAEFSGDDRLIVVTTRLEYSSTAGTFQSPEYRRTELKAGDPITRFSEMLRILNADEWEIDPLYCLMRRSAVAPMPRRNALHEDQAFASKLALAGPWGHVDEVLGARTLNLDPISAVARRLGLPAWHAPLANTMLAVEIFRSIPADGLTNEQRRRARRAVARMYLTRQGRVARYRARHLRLWEAGRWTR